MVIKIENLDLLLSDDFNVKFKEWYLNTSGTDGSNMAKIKSAFDAMKSEIEDHEDDTVAHVTAADRIAWNSDPDVSGQISTHNSSDGAHSALFAGKQNVLVSGENVKTVNGESILGEGDLVVSSETPVINEQFECTQSTVYFTVPANGEYTITAAGASGSGGNHYDSSYITVGGKGALVTTKITLEAGDVLAIAVGGQGSCIQATADDDGDGTSGGGGGCTIIAKQIASITNAGYQVQKSDQSYEILMCIAGGGGGCDGTYKSDIINGIDGDASTVYSPTNFESFTTESTDTSNDVKFPGGGISQWALWDGYALHFNMGEGRSQGGYNGGGTNDDDIVAGGGWYIDIETATAYSFSQGEIIQHTSGANEGDGCVFITSDVLPITNGGTGVSSVQALKAILGMHDSINDSINVDVAECILDTNWGGTVYCWKTDGVLTIYFGNVWRNSKCITDNFNDGDTNNPYDRIASLPAGYISEDGGSGHVIEFIDIDNISPVFIIVSSDGEIGVRGAAAGRLYPDTGLSGTITYPLSFT